MAKLTYGMMISLDGYINDRNGRFDWGHVDDELHAHANDEARRVGTDIYGRRMYETMVYWETYDGAVAHESEFARLWQANDKIVVSKSLKEIGSSRTRLVTSISADEMRQLKADQAEDIAVSGPTIASRFIADGLVNEVGIYYVPVVVGGGTPFFKDIKTTLKLERLEERPFKNGTVFIRYRLLG